MTDKPVSIPTPQAFLRGLPWIFLILVFAFVSWAFWEPFFRLFMDARSAQFASIGMGTIGAYVICLFALAGNWPFAGIRNIWARGIAMIALAKAVAALFWIALVRGFGVDMASWSFPIIGNAWLILAATSFVGGDTHLKDIPPVRRMFLNLIIATGGTIVLMRTIVLFPTYWFTFLQATIVTGGLGYLFRRVKQPTFSALSWSLLMALMWLGLVCASLCGHFALLALELRERLGRIRAFFRLDLRPQFFRLRLHPVLAVLQDQATLGNARRAPLHAGLVLCTDPHPDAAVPDAGSWRRSLMAGSDHGLAHRFLGIRLGVLFRRRTNSLSLGRTKDARRLGRCGIGSDVFPCLYF